MYNQVILVDKEDNMIGPADKLEAHMGAGQLHRAFSVFIFNSKGELLLQQRSKTKLLWPLFWSNSCCSHPLEKETYEKAGHRRLHEELGFTSDLEFVFKFCYQAKYNDRGSENELCAVLLGKSDEPPAANPEEIEDYKYIAIADLMEDIKVNREKYTPWFLIEIEKLTSEYGDKLKEYLL